MMPNIIQFISNRPWIAKSDINKPSPIIKFIPSWFRDADRFAVDPRTNEFWIGPDGGKVPTWKACPALFDIMTTGYSLVTPCDIEFFINKNGDADCKVSDERYRDFCSPRPQMPQFEQPYGFYKEHFAWFPEWAVKAPDGYSVIYSSPFNRYDLPFMTVSGIIDNDKVNLPGSMPFFVREGWTGIIPAGTPYAQMIPFKREDWSSSYLTPDHHSMIKSNMENSKKYRVPNGGIYKNKIWSKRSYE